MKNENVSRQITSWLQAECDQQLKARTSSKSLWKGANTQLAISRKITKQQRLVRGGWAAVDKSDIAAYKDVNPALTYPPMLELGGWPDPQARVYPMRLPLCQGDKNLRHGMQILVDNIYLNNIESFVKLPNMLPPFISTCILHCIRYNVSC
jgi:hypothetical protein